MLVVRLMDVYWAVRCVDKRCSDELQLWMVKLRYNEEWLHVMAGVWVIWLVMKQELKVTQGN